MQRKIVTYLLVAYVLFSYYNTLIPFSFDYGFADLAEQLKQVVVSPISLKIAITDIVGNIILFMPFGFLLFMFLHYRHFRSKIIICIVAGFLLSLSIELLQLFIKSRNSAIHDLLNNTVGTAIGAIAAAIYANRISSGATRLFYDLLQRKPFLLLLTIFGAAQTIAAVMPFTVSITVSHFKRSIKSSNFVPFDYQSVGALFMNDPNNHDLRPFDYTSMVADLLYWAVIGYLLMICYRIYWRKKSRGKLMLIGLPLLFFPAIEFVQLFITSRITDINDIISGYGGVALGVIAYHLLRPIRRKQFKHHIDLLILPAVMYMVFTLFTGLRPFDWTLDPEVISADLVPDRLIPFYAYFRATSLWNMYDLITSLTYFLPVSCLISYLMRQKDIAYAKIYPITVSVGLIIGFMIELTQLFSPTRISEITDVIAYGGGGWLGTFAIYYYHSEVQPRVRAISAAS